MAKKENKNEISKLKFEDAIKELKVLVDKIEQGELGLEDSLEQYERGMVLIKHCRELLGKAEKRIEKISNSKGGEEGVEQ